MTGEAVCRAPCPAAESELTINKKVEIRRKCFISLLFLGIIISGRVACLVKAGILCYYTITSNKFHREEIYGLLQAIQILAGKRLF